MKPIKRKKPSRIYPGVNARQVLDPPKPQRNAPCPCNSGKKYKRCCWIAIRDMPSIAQIPPTLPDTSNTGTPATPETRSMAEGRTPHRRPMVGLLGIAAMLASTMAFDAPPPKHPR